MAEPLTGTRVVIAEEHDDNVTSFCPGGITSAFIPVVVMECDT
jgi:hypothetical protein